MGCYKDRYTRDLENGPRKWGYTVETCGKACSAFLYFGLQVLPPSGTCLHSIIVLRLVYFCCMVCGLSVFFLNRSFLH